MEEIFKRFAGLGKGILDQIDDKNLAKSRKINQRWKNFIDREKTIWIRMIKKQVGNFSTSQDWQKGKSVSLIHENIFYYPSYCKTYV